MDLFNEGRIRPYIEHFILSVSIISVSRNIPKERQLHKPQFPSGC